MKPFKVAWFIVLILAACVPAEDVAQPVESVGQALNKSGSRIEVRKATNHYTFADGSQVETGSRLYLYDTTLNLECSVTWMTADSKTRCTPSAYYNVASNGPFADSACSQKLVRGPTPFYPYAIDGTKWYAVSYPITPTPATLYYIGGAGCFASTYTCGSAPCSPAWAVYRLGAEVSPSDFLEASVLTTTEKM